MLQKQIRNIVVLLSVLVVAFPAQAKKPTDPDDLFNPLLGPDYSHWMVGPLVEIATEEEVEEFLLLVSDEDAQAFVERFWDRRNAGAELFTKTPRQIYEARAEDADKRFTEGAYPGRRTDRGAILILYGEPESIEFESPRKVNDPPLEVWRYKKREEGLDGEKPKKQYRFVDLGRSVVRYTGQKLPPNLQRRLDRQRRF